MTDKLNSSNSTPNGKDENLENTWVPDAAADEGVADTGATFIGAPEPDSDADQITPKKDVSAIDVNATFVPGKAQSQDEDREFEGDADSTFIGPQPTDDGEQEGAIDPERSDDKKTLVNTASTEIKATPDSDADLTIIGQDFAVSTDATIVGKDIQASEADDEDQRATEQISRHSSGQRKSGSGSKVSSQVWTKSASSSLDELISIRTRSVSGTGHFAPSDDADFEIIEKLAEGGMGVVYVALQKSLNRQLAIKTLKGGGRSGSGTVGRLNTARQLSKADKQKREMFLSEALVTANLVHPNIIPIHELAETDEGTPYYVMKQVHGIPWNKRIREMTLEQNLDVLHKVCDAVAYAHHNGVINRDLKPENIMLGEFGEVLVLDWGLAVPAPHAAAQNFRSPVASFGAGTPAYMSPELWTGPPEAIGECSDIYLLGAILFEAITGKTPHDFPRSSAHVSRTEMWNTIDTVLRENRIRETTESGELFDIALKAMRTNPEERFGSVLEFQFSVRNFQRHEESRRLSARATELMGSQATHSHDYHTYQTAAALYEESLRTWPKNDMARTGLRTTRLLYAQRAAAKGDYDLGLQVAAQESDEEFLALSKKLKNARRMRSGVKWTALTAVLCVVALGAKSIYDNGIITDLNAEVSERKAAANEAILAADTAKEVAKSETAAADDARAIAKIAQQAAEEANIVAAESTEKARLAKLEATDALASAEASKLEAKNALATADASKLEANKAVAAAEAAKVMLATAEKDTEKAIEQQRQAETASRIAQVEIQSQSIRGLTLNRNYSDAIREIDRLLNGELLPKLPEAIRDQRTIELQAQREQLMKRARPSEDPVQSQAISPDGEWIALGDSSGLVTVLQSPGDQLTWQSENSLHFQFKQQISSLQFVDSTTLVIASGSELFLWKLKDHDPVLLTGHEHAIQALDTSGSLLLSADESGVVLIRSLDSGQILITLNLRTRLRDVAFIPGSKNFICAGSRGGQSADIIAYGISQTGPEYRAVRLGQLRMSREHNEPPQRISITPDGQLLAISNSTNGNLVVLHAAEPSKGSNNRFPFEHPSDLEAVGNMAWLLSEHDRPINDIAWSEDGNRCLTAADDRTIRVWSRTSNPRSILSCETVLRGHGARVTQAKFLNKAANQVASSSADRLNRLWDLRTLTDDERRIQMIFDLARSVPRSPTQERAKVSGPGEYLPTGLTNESDDLAQPRSARSNYASDDSEETGEPADETEKADEIRLNEEPKLHRGSVQAIQFNDDGQRLVTGATDGSIVIWNTRTAAPVANPVTSRQAANEQFQEGHQFNIARMSIIGPSGTLLATAGYDGSLRLWNMDPDSRRVGIQRQVIAGLGLVNTFAASPNGEFLVTSAVQGAENQKSGECSLWNLADVLQSKEAVSAGILSGVHNSEVTAIAVSPDNRKIVTGGRDGVIAVWDSRKTQLVTSLRAHAKNTIVTSLQWLPDGTLLSSGLDGQLAHWKIEEDSTNTESPSHLAKIRVFQRDKTPIEQMHVSPGGKQFLTLSVETDRATKVARQHLDIWSAEDPEFRRRVLLAKVAGKQPESISSAEWSPNGRQLIVCADGIVQIVDCDSWKIARVFAVGHGSCTNAQIADQLSQAQGKDFLMTFDGTSAHLWRLENGELIASFRGPFPISTLAFLTSSDQQFIVSGGASLRIFDAREDQLSFGRPLFRTREGAAAEITAVSICPTDPTLFAAASAKGTVTAWRWNAAKLYAEQIRILAKFGRPLSSCRWSKDGSRVLAIGLDGTLAICTQDTTVFLEFQVENDEAIELFAGDFSPDGAHIVVAGQIENTFESMAWILEVPTAVAAEEKTDGIPGESTAPGRGLRDDANNGAHATIQSRIVCLFSGHEAGGISSVCFIPDSPYIVSGGNDGAMLLWNWKQPLPGSPAMAYQAFRFMTRGQVTAHSAPITDIAVAATGQIASSGTDGKVSLWKLPIKLD